MEVWLARSYQPVFKFAVRFETGVADSVQKLADFSWCKGSSLVQNRRSFGRTPWGSLMANLTAECFQFTRPLSAVADADLHVRPSDQSNPIENKTGQAASELPLVPRRVKASS